MSDCMAFPKTAEEFIEQYKFTDTKQEYTNGAELMPVFRVKQMLEHYFANGIRALDRLGEFGRLFVGYKGCPRGAVGRSCAPLEEEVFEMPKIMDVDGGEWIPVNAAALHELVGQYKKLREVARWIPVTERLPEAFLAVLAYCPNGGNIYEVYLNTRSEWHFFDESVAGAVLQDAVTHWMPLPEPPKGGCKVKVGARVRYIHEDSECEKSLGYFPPIGTLGTVKMVDPSPEGEEQILVQWDSGTTGNGRWWCYWTDVEVVEGEE